MIHTIYSNSYEVLRAVLLSNVTALGFDEPGGGTATEAAFFARAFEKVPVIIPSRAVEEDLRQAIARRDGVCAGMDFMPLSAWMGFFSKEPLANVVGNEADWMIWRILREDGPGSFRREPGHERLSHYLDGKTDSEIYSLSRHISAVFVVYATYRVDWVLGWLGIHPELVPDGPDRREEQRRLEAHPDFVWQCDLWRRLADCPNWQGRGFLSDFPDTLRRLAGSAGRRMLTLDGGRRVPLPPALHIFAPFVVPPLMLPILKAFAQSGRDVWFYLLNPCSEYWFDLVPRRLFDWRSDDGGEAAVGHPILADNGRSTRANLDRLWRFTAVSDPELRLTEIDLPKPAEPAAAQERCFLRAFAGRPQELTADLAAEFQSFYLESREPALLRRIQDSVLTLTPLNETAEGAGLFNGSDCSLFFMRAPTATRELEGLADWLQNAFQTDPDLKPDDVLVVTPDISSSAPLVDKVFGSLPEGRRIAWRFTGLRALDTDTAAQAFFALASLMTGRARREEFESWLSMPLVSQRFGLSVSDLSAVSTWLRGAGYRFGLSDGHLMSLDPWTFAHVREMTLERAVERLTLGFMLPDEEKKPFGDTVPIRGSEEEGWVSTADQPSLLAVLAGVSALLEEFRLRTAGLKPAREWTDWIADAFGAFFPAERGDVSYTRLRSAAADMRREIERAGEAGGEEPEISFELFIKAVSERLEGQPGGGAGTNAVTFTGMAQLRAIPYKVIAVFGLNDDCAFPGSTRREEFDLMAAAPRRGDRDSRIDNRNVFLDLLLAARQRFLISYVCGTGAGAVERRPSIVAQELLDWILSHAESRRERRAAEKQLTVTLSLNAFSPDNFRTGTRGWRSHDRLLLSAVTAAARSGYRGPETRLADSGVTLGETAVPLSALYAFWKAPSSWALRALGITLPERLTDKAEGLMPDSGGLAAWQRSTEAFKAAVSEEGLEALRSRWAADPRCGAAGVRDWAVEKDLNIGAGLAEAFLARTAGLASADDRQIEVRPDPSMPVLTHRLTGLYESPGGLLLVRATASSLKGSGTARAFFEYVHARAAGTVLQADVVCRGSDDEPVSIVTFPPVSETDAAHVLSAVLGLYVRTAGCAASAADTTGPSQGYKTKEQKDFRAESLLWRGRDLAGARKTREKLEKGLAGMIAAGSPEEFAEALQAFERAASEPF
ncbi:MAG: exodeoxyribonuclease V subunit gamma [Sutterella sp.]|nr:exodeoxyribonuclease V subunit gamma [Sutterella sp.]